jgi:hypothetical protein
MGEGWGGGDKILAGKRVSRIYSPSPKPPPIKGRGLYGNHYFKLLKRISATEKLNA